MKVVADESVDGPIVARLREDGHEVDYIAEMEPGISDDRVLSHANLRQALLITTDKDFGELVFRQGRLNAGVLLLRLPGVLPSQKAAIVSRAVTAHGTEMQTAFTVRRCLTASGSVCSRKRCRYERRHAACPGLSRSHPARNPTNRSLYEGHGRARVRTGNEMAQDAVIRNIEIIGEAARNIARRHPAPLRIRKFLGKMST